MSYHAFSFVCVRQTQEKLKGGDKISSKEFSTSALSLTNGRREMFHNGCVVFVPFELHSRLLILAVVMEAYKVFVPDTLQDLFPVLPVCWSLHFCSCICHVQNKPVQRCL